MNVEGQKIKVLMLGWEFPPIKSGGLGTACKGIVDGLLANQVDVHFVMPHAHPQHREHYSQIIGLFDRFKRAYEHLLTIHTVDMDLFPYAGASWRQGAFVTRTTHTETGYGYGDGSKQVYDYDLFDQIERYAALVEGLVEDLDFDVIHAHDWMTFLAGIRLKQLTGKPLIVHVHATEHDRTGGNPYQRIYDIERAGVAAADLVVTVSNYTKRLLERHYGLSSSKIRVVYNAIETYHRTQSIQRNHWKHLEKTVLFLGRVTVQKGPDYFLQAAEQVLKVEPNTKFVLVGDGDMAPGLIERAAAAGLSKHLLFAGFLTGDEVDLAFQMADVYVMPSVSEPFGITALESLANGTPVIISKQSGVAEIMDHALKVDFWDVKQLADRIVAVLRHKHTLGQAMVVNGRSSLKGHSWVASGKTLKDIYYQLA